MDRRPGRFRFGFGLIIFVLFGGFFFGNLVVVGFDFAVFWRIWFYFPFLFYLSDVRNVNSDLFWHC